MRTRKFAPLFSIVTVLSSVALAGLVAACSSAGADADPTFEPDNADNGSDGANNTGKTGSGSDGTGNATGSGADNGAAGGDDDSGSSATGPVESNPGSGTPTTDWTTVYKSLFASGTVGHCGNSGCHDIERHGFNCGTTSDACYQGLIAADLIDTTDPASSQLGDSKQSPLAWFSGKGMPADAQKVDKTATATVVEWLKAGAPNHGVALGGTPDAGAPIKDAGMDATADAGSHDAGHDAGKDSGASDAGKDAGHDAGKDAGHDAGPAAETWTELYGTYFGPSTPGHCGNSGCHAKAKAGFTCGSTSDACYKGMIAAGLIDTSSPATSDLGNATNTPLSWFGEGGEMPKDQQQKLPAGVAAIQSWLNAGALEN